MKKAIFFFFLIGLAGLVHAQEAKAKQQFFYVHAEQPAAPLNLDWVIDQIAYPDELLDEGVEGKVVLRVLVDAKGNYRMHQVVKSDNSLFTDAVETAIDQLAFTPAKNKGLETVSWVFVPVRFKVQPHWARAN